MRIRIRIKAPMAAPITHIILAKRWLKLYPNQYNEHKFLLGTSFPDIRYLQVISREETHTNPVTKELVLTTEDPFQAGMKLHALVDSIRQKRFQKSSLYASDQDTIRAWKLLEDKTLYNELSSLQWQEIANYFEEVREEERLFNIPETALRKWHILLQNYFRSGPTKKACHEFMEILQIPEPRIVKIETILTDLESNLEAKTLIESVYTNFFKIENYN